jgi:hypothetical protein
LLSYLKRRRVHNVVWSVYKALGGGWTLDQTPLAPPRPTVTLRACGAR